MSDPKTNDGTNIEQNEQIGNDHHATDPYLADEELKETEAGRQKKSENPDIRGHKVRRRKLSGDSEEASFAEPVDMSSFLNTEAGSTEPKGGRNVADAASEDSVFFSVPKEDSKEEPAFGELIFGEKISAKRVDVNLRPERRSRRARKAEPEIVPEEDEGYEELDDYEKSGIYDEEDYYEEPEADFEELEIDEDYDPEEEIRQIEEEEARRKQEAREKRKEQLKKELEEQLRKEREEAQRRKEQEAKERRRQEEKALREQEKQEEKERKEKEKKAEKERKEKEKEEARIRREQIRQTAEYRKRVKILRITMSILAVIILTAVAIFLIDRYVKLNQYSIVSSIEMTNLDENSDVYKYHNGYVKCAGDGITYFDHGGIIWNEILSMADPLFDVCGEYIAASDMKSTEVYVYGPSGFIDKFSLNRVVIDVEVSEFGTVAVATNEGDSNYIELKDKAGSDIATVKTVFSSTGYLTDIALSPDGSKLAAAYILVADGNIESKVVFYDFSKKINQGENVTIGEFTQYKSTLITSLHYMDGDRVAAVGDNAFTIYSVAGDPMIIYEDLAYPWQINSLFFNNRYIGFVVENQEGEDAYAVKAYNLNGKLVCDQSFDFAYNHVSFAGNAVLLYSNYDCDVYNFAGTHKFSYSFDNRIFTMESAGDNINYILMTQGQTQFIRLR